MAKKFETEEEVKAFMQDQATKLGEVFSQCWESEEFKKDFMDDPKKVFEKYGLEYDDSKDYRILDTPPKTIIQVLPYENTKVGVQDLAARLLKTVEDLKTEDSKQILLEDWKWEIRQSTEDVFYLPIPLCPENLSPEELEMVNGGCIIAAIFFLFAAAAVAQSAASVTTIFLAVLSAFAAVVDVAAGLIVALAAVEAIVFGTSISIASQISTITIVTDSDSKTPTNDGAHGGGAAGAAGGVHGG
ncbi:MAG: hypothetical protein IJ821_03145 [Lachnospiraceae bacterium]|nr:hypothetical protein [Lachnospiraceae bacterium]